MTVGKADHKAFEILWSSCAARKLDCVVTLTGQGDKSRLAIEVRAADKVIDSIAVGPKESVDAAAKRLFLSMKANKILDA